MTDSSIPGDNHSASDDSFLTDVQREGKARGSVENINLDKAVADVNIILSDEIAQIYRSKEEKDWPTLSMAIYCHDCRAIVPGGIGKTIRGNPRTVCGVCNSKKISMGREEALRQFYHLGKKEE